MTASPVCNFVCGPLDQNDIFSVACHQYCEQRKDCALTPNILYTFANGIFTERNIFIRGVGDIITQNGGDLSFRLSIYQQLPWVLGFIIVMIILVLANIVSPSTALFFSIAAILLAVFFIYLSSADTQNTLRVTADQIERQLNVDYQAARDALRRDLSAPLFNAVRESQVPCGCMCPVMGTGVGGAD
jgi:hypothetical protein